MVEQTHVSASTNRFIRIGGFFFLLFGLMAILFRVTQFMILGDPPLEALVIAPSFLLLQGIPSLFAAIFFLVGATALYLRQAPRAGLISLVVYFIAFSALSISAGAMWTYAFTAPVLAREYPALLTSPSSGIISAVLGSMILGQFGWLLMAIDAYRAKVIPRWAALFSIGSIVLVVLMTPIAQTQLLRLIYNILLGAGPLAIGFVLWKK